MLSSRINNNINFSINGSQNKYLDESLTNLTKQAIASKNSLQKIQNSDGVIVSLAEHNGNFSVALKNILDWVSRIEMGYLKDKKLLFVGVTGSTLINPSKRRRERKFSHKKAVFSLPQSTTLTAPLKGSHTECVVCRKSLLEAGCHGVIGKRDVEAPSCTNAYLLFLCGRPMIAPTEGRE